jgi:hypothetical protein
VSDKADRNLTAVRNNPLGLDPIIEVAGYPCQRAPEKARLRTAFPKSVAATAHAVASVGDGFGAPKPCGWPVAT